MKVETEVKRCKAQLSKVERAVERIRAKQDMQVHELRKLFRAVVKTVTEVEATAALAAREKQSSDDHFPPFVADTMPSWDEIDEMLLGKGGCKYDRKGTTQESRGRRFRY